MVKAAVKFIYGDKSYFEGDEIPKELVPELEKHQSHVLETYVSVNGTWHRIDDPLIKGWVETRKPYEARLIKYFNIKDEKPDSNIPSSADSNMLRARPKKSDKRKKLEEKAEQMGFEKFRTYANKKYKVTGRSTEGIINDIIAGKIEL